LGPENSCQQVGGEGPPKIRSRPSLSFLYVKNSIARTRKRKILRAKERRSGGQDANGNGEIGRVVTDKTDWQQVLHPGSIFANNDAGQARFLGLKTPASKWGGERSSQIFRKISVDPRSSAAEKVLRLLLLRTENRELLQNGSLRSLNGMWTTASRSTAAPFFCAGRKRQRARATRAFSSSRESTPLSTRTLPTVPSL